MHRIYTLGQARSCFCLLAAFFLPSNCCWWLKEEQPQDREVHVEGMRSTVHEEANMTPPPQATYTPPSMPLLVAADPLLFDAKIRNGGTCPHQICQRIDLNFQPIKRLDMHTCGPDRLQTPGRVFWSARAPQPASVPRLPAYPCSCPAIRSFAGSPPHSHIPLSLS